MRLKPSTYFVLFLILLMLAIIWISLGNSYLELKLLPLSYSSIILVLAAVQLCREVRQSRADTAANRLPQQEIDTSQRRYRLGSALALISGFALSIYLLGFLIAIAVFSLSYLKLHKRGWIISIVYTVIVLVFVYGIFEFGLNARLYRGLIFGGQ